MHLWCVCMCVCVVDALCVVRPTEPDLQPGIKCHAVFGRFRVGCVGVRLHCAMEPGICRARQLCTHMEPTCAHGARHGLPAVLHAVYRCCRSLWKPSPAGPSSSHGSAQTSHARAEEVFLLGQVRGGASLYRDVPCREAGVGVFPVRGCSLQGDGSGGSSLFGDVPCREAGVGGLPCTGMFLSGRRVWGVFPVQGCSL